MFVLSIMNHKNIDNIEVQKKLIKYLTVIFIMSLMALLIPRVKLEMSEVYSIGLMGGTLFAIIDTFAPSYVVTLDKNGIITKII